MASSTSHKMKLKLMVDKNKNKVIYAEAQKDFVDLLIYLLSLPLSAVVKYLANAPTVPGSIGNLYSGIESITKAGYIKPPHDDKSLTGHSPILVPHLLTHVRVLPRLTTASQTTMTKTLYNCKNNHRHVTDTVATYAACSYCVFPMTTEVKFTVHSSPTTMEADYVKDVVSYMVGDDLSVSPLNSASVFGALKGCDPGDVVEKEVQFRSSEVLELLNASFHSKQPLTTVFLKPK